MIDNFDRLVERCTARRRRQIIRTSLMVAGSILLVVAGIAGFEQWRAANKSVSQSSIPSAPKSPPPKNPSEHTPAPQPAVATVPEPPLSAAASAAPAPSAAPIAAIAAVTSKAPVAAGEPLRERSEALFDVRSSAKTDPMEAYQASPRYETALAVAREHYAQDNFAEAVIWAKKANQHNREAEEAWLLTARAYHAQGRKSEAIGVLELYLNYKESKAAIELLKTWKQGE